MKRFGIKRAAFCGIAPNAGWTAGVLGALLLASASVCAAQPRTTGDERAAKPSEERVEHLERRGFYRRRAAGYGWFLTRSDPEVARSRTLSDVLRMVPGVNLSRQGSGARVATNRASGFCAMAVFVDGMFTTIRNVDELTLEDVAALEVYRGPSEVPIEFHAPAFARTCGALLVWSRMDMGEE